MPLSDNDRRRWMRRVERDQRVIVQTRAPELRRLFGQIANDVSREYMRRPTLYHALRVARRGNVPMAQLLSTIWIESGHAAGRHISEFVNAPINPASRAELQRTGARRVTRVTRLQMQSIRDAIRVGQQAGLNQFEIATGRGRKAELLAQETNWRPIRSVVDQTYRNRDITIARTEAALAHQVGSNSEYRYHDITHVEWLDSPDCGVNGHLDQQKANGMIVTLAMNARFPISHPNCVRASAPVVD